MPKPKHEPVKPKRFLWFHHVIVKPESQDVFVSEKGKFYLARKSGKRKKGE